ncbi:hypothetical protein [Methylotuvimicrobium sp. KM2]|uniref:hypothetical protein n=1 Tax=Methylotuvimicrobium sp. KM2 TaxID=3133976 RepID=UPI0031012918
MNQLNYSSKAIDDLLLKAKSHGARIDSQSFSKVASLLEQAVKFQLPDNGDLFEDGFRALPAIFRLPYPVIAAEFQIVRNARLEHQPLSKRGEEVIASSKRIALAIEINTDNFEEFLWMLPKEKFNLLTLDGAIAIIPVFYLDGQQQWTIPPLGVVIPSRKIDPRPDLEDQTKKIYGNTLPKGMQQVPLEEHPIVLMPEYVRELQSVEGPDYIMAVTAQDTHDESRAILGLLEILSCKNVVTETVQPPKALNKKRLAKGKLPFFEYKILTLPNESVSNKASGGTHASPRVHLRRGHIRRLPGKNIWVNATIVGNSDLGVVIKDYSVTKS